MHGGFTLAIVIALLMILFPEFFSRSSLGGLKGVPPGWIRRIGYVLLAALVFVLFCLHIYL